MKKLTLLGGLTPRQFLRDYWHKKPLFIKGAFPHFEPTITRNDLFALTKQDNVESRLITYAKNKWTLQQGPFKKLPSLKKNHWTTLVQGVNLHDQKTHQLLEQFRFLPDARLDDLMVSFATPFGGVGPHVDSYDVFLLQAQGEKEWQISKQTQLALQENVPLKILKEFIPQETYILSPGDMLYLPPHYAHNGIALNEGMTYSIGFRAPTFQELGEAFLENMLETIALPGRYADPDLTYQKHPARISSTMLKQISRAFQKLMFTQKDRDIFLGEYLTQPKLTTLFSHPLESISLRSFSKKIEKYILTLSPASRMLYHGKYLFMNGESFEVKGQDRALLIELANLHILSGTCLKKASSDLQETFLTWHEAGWIDIKLLA